MARPLVRTLFTATALAGLALAPATATAEPIPPQAAEPSAKVVHLTVEGGLSQQHRSMWLSCSPAGGAHPRAKEACEALTEAKGEFKALKGARDTMCPLIYRPATAKATGYWNGTRVHYEEEFANTCVLKSYTGPVFDFAEPQSR